MISQIDNNKKDKILNLLNQQQKEAIKKTSGIVKIVAGSGTGKTKVILAKATYLVNVLNVDPSKILILTSNNRTQHEAKERLRNNFECDKQINIDTFYSLCAKILNEEKNNFKIDDKNLILIDTFTQKEILRETFFNFTKEVLKYGISTDIMLDYISNIKISCQDLKDIEKEIKQSKDVCEYLKFKIFQNYQKNLKKSFLLDYNDLLYYVNVLFEKKEKIKQKWANQFEYILVDEFQDINQLQLKILFSILPKTNINLTIVGDPNQAISNTLNSLTRNYIYDFDDFLKQHTKQKIFNIYLNINYRSPNKILTFANKLISKNDENNSFYLISSNDLSEENKTNDQNYETYFANSRNAEAVWILNQIDKLKKNKIQLKDIAIIYRLPKHILDIEDLLIEQGISYKSYNSKKFINKEHIQNVITFLRLLEEPSDFILQKTLKILPQYINKENLDIIISFANEKKLSIYSSWLKYLGDIKVPNKTKKNIVFLVNTINKYRAILNNINKQALLSRIIDSFLNEIGYYKFYNLEKEPVILDDIRKFIKSIKNYEENNPNVTLGQYLEYLSFLSLNHEIVNSNNYISLLPIQQSKGMEFKYVFIVGLNENEFPLNLDKYQNKKLKKEKLIEERMMFYIAITRAKNYIYFSAIKNNKENQFLPSRFFKEVGIKINSNQNLNDENTNNGNKQFYVGEQINHSVYGKGLILEINKDSLKIKFQNDNILNILKTFKSLEKVK